MLISSTSTLLKDIVHTTSVEDRLNFLANLISYYSKLPIRIHKQKLVHANANQVKKSAAILGIRKSVEEWMLNKGSCSYTLTKYWRGLQEYIKTNNLLLSAKNYGVKKEDLLYSVDILRETGILELAVKYVNKNAVTKVIYTEKDIDAILETIRPRIKANIYQKLSFLTKSDQVESYEDLISDFTIVARTAMLKADKISNVNKLKSIALKSVHNAIINKIDAVTAKKRSKLVQLSAREGTTEAEYLTTTISIDNENGEQAMLFDQDPTNEVMLNVNLIKMIYKTANKQQAEKIVKYLDIIINEKEDYGFYTWLAQQRDIGSENNTLIIIDKINSDVNLSSNKLQKYLQKYLGVSKNDLDLLAKCYLDLSDTNSNFHKKEAPKNTENNLESHLEDILSDYKEELGNYFKITRLYEYNEDFIHYIIKINLKFVNNLEGLNDFQKKRLFSKANHFVDRLSNNQLRKVAREYLNLKKTEIKQVKEITKKVKKLELALV